MDQTQSESLSNPTWNQLRKSLIASPLFWTLLGLTGVFALFHFLFNLGYKVDDAFISFRYAKHLAWYGELAFNLGEPPVEGYTNLLWVLFMAFGLVFTVEPDLFSTLLGFILLLGTLYLVFDLARLFFQQKNSTWLVLPALIVVSLSFVVYWFQAGLETGLFTFLITLAVRIYIAERHSTRWAGLGIVLFFLVLCRPEGLFIGVFFLLFHGVVVILIRGEQPWNRADTLNILTFIIPLGFYVVFKWVYFGELLPNTYYAKYVGTQVDIRRGLLYTRDFFLNYPFFMAIFPALLIIQRKDPPIQLAKEVGILLGIWSLGIVLVYLIFQLQHEWLFDNRYGTFMQQELAEQLKREGKSLDYWLSNQVALFNIGYPILFAFFLVTTLGVFVYRVFVKPLSSIYLLLFGLPVALIFLIAYLGGDNMNSYRFFVPLIPLMAVILIKVILVLFKAENKEVKTTNSESHTKKGTRPSAKMKQRSRQNMKTTSSNQKQRSGWLFLILLLILGVHLYQTFFTEQLVPQIYNHRIAYNGKVVGTYLKEHYPSDTFIATNAAGALPYYSEMRTLDLLGLNDRTIARSMRDIDYKNVGGMGHEKGNEEYVLGLDPPPDLLFFGNSAGDKDPHYPGDTRLFEHPDFLTYYEPEPIHITDLPNTMKPYTKLGSLGAYEDNLFRLKTQLDQINQYPDNPKIIQARQQIQNQLNSLTQNGIPWRGAYMNMMVDKSGWIPIATIRFQSVEAYFYKRKNYNTM